MADLQEIPQEDTPQHTLANINALVVRNFDAWFITKVITFNFTLDNDINIGPDKNAVVVNTFNFFERYENSTIKREEIEETSFSSTDSNRGRIVAHAVKEACTIASLGRNHQDWDAACKLILQNKSLTNKEKRSIITLIYGKHDYLSL
ncbi:6350_t:CDS:2 [Funneliformis geosporum]|uniref:18066_t:CDS:1 n=1 Tax=Funneliformis geosporum TaxID=1117311 RepID=A0A9W4SDX7_9GLOM|nr:18066_t:CDS:2 [Funneliformis geosporum]CAI2166534.1 6350_t:CDS:2 [Funneliformis geosporum]